LPSIFSGKSHRTRFSQVFRHGLRYGHDLDPSLSQALAFYSLAADAVHTTSRRRRRT
jgi:hypothetical protein